MVNLDKSGNRLDYCVGKIKTDLINKAIRSFPHNQPILDSYRVLSDPDFSETVTSADYDSEENLQYGEGYIA